ncbi:MAG: electron transfer flavoprotein subunit beta/FixA family protein [Thermoanaerobaculia bacterium]|nr:electron transfer flavoprotein subunit beta/FixA family protein [Thermoanaerobaculia bacterium]
MRIAVCIKQVPDTEARLRLRRDERWIDEEDVPFVINESDEYALEEALQLAEASEGEVVVFTLGPERAKEALRKALAVGADRAVHLRDDALEGGDASTTGAALARAIEREECDLVLTGSQSDDVGFGATGGVIAGHLGWPHAWLVMGVEVEEEGTARVVREMESGVNEIVRLRLPAVLEIQAGLNHPRYASLRGIMQAKKKELSEVGASDLDLAPEATGAAGALTEVVSVGFPESGEGAEILEGDAEVAARQLVERLRREAKVL